MTLVATRVEVTVMNVVRPVATTGDTWNAKVTRAGLLARVPGDRNFEYDAFHSIFIQIGRL